MSLKGKDVTCEHGLLKGACWRCRLNTVTAERDAANDEIARMRVGVVDAVFKDLGQDILGADIGDFFCIDPGKLGLIGQPHAFNIFHDKNVF